MATKPKMHIVGKATPRPEGKKYNVSTRKQQLAAAAKRKSDAAAKTKAAAVKKAKAAVKPYPKQGKYTVMTRQQQLARAALNKLTKPPVVTTKTGAVTKPKTTEELIGTDPQYIREKSDLGTTMSDFLADKARLTGIANVDYETGLSAANEENKQNVGNLANSYGARGLMSSGLYAGASSDLANQATTKTSALSTNKTNTLADLASKQTQLQHTQASSIADAQQRALARRAAKLGQL